jgi:peptidyl-dipeptidase Dcp
MNLVKADGENTVLVSPGQVETLYHEGGHALHGLKGTQAKYLSRMGTGNGSDYVEIHSMMSENWAFHPDVVSKYAKHYKTGAAVPPALLEAKEKSEGFMASWDMLRLVQNASRDINFHSLDASNYTNDADVETASRLPSSLSDHVRPYPLTRFSHLFSGADSQYAAGYYGYLWAEVKANQAFDLFAQNGVYDAATLKQAQKFFSLGAALEPNAAFDTSYGLNVLNTSPFLAKYGIKAPSTSANFTENKLTGTSGKAPKFH